MSSLTSDTTIHVPNIQSLLGANKRLLSKASESEQEKHDERDRKKYMANLRRRRQKQRKFAKKKVILANARAIAAGTNILCELAQTGGVQELISFSEDGFCIYETSLKDSVVNNPNIAEASMRIALHESNMRISFTLRMTGGNTHTGSRYLYYDRPDDYANYITFPIRETGEGQSLVFTEVFGKGIVSRSALKQDVRSKNIGRRCLYKRPPTKPEWGIVDVPAQFFLDCAESAENINWYLKKATSSL